MSSIVLPAYVFPSASPPDYSSLPLEDEQTIAYTPRPGSSTQQGNYLRCWKHASLILRGQDETARVPVYSRGAPISGELGIANPENVDVVSIKLYGQLSLTVADCGSTGATLVYDTRLLWKHDEQDSRDQRCPSILPFALRFPLTYVAPDGKAWKLPPSFEASFMGIPSLFARCIYTLDITITRTRRYRLGSWTTSKTFTTMLNYKPRTRPQRPVVLIDTIFRSIKPVPEEWSQLMVNMETRLGSEAKPIECHFLVPSVQTFSITDTIPFHIQLCSSLGSLRELLPATCVLLNPSNVERKHKGAMNANNNGDNAIRVYIARQIHVEINGRRRYRTYTIGTANIWPVPPVMTRGGEVHSHTSSSDEICLDWQGEVKCWGEVTTGGFNVGSLLVKDFIVMALSPSSIRGSYLLPAQLAHPIRLVTDSWVDLDSIHPQDI